MTPYTTTDKTISYMNRQYGKLFRRVTSFDELNVIDVSHEIYDEVYELAKQEAARLSEAVYKKNRTDDTAVADSEFNAAVFVLALALAYNPTTKYIFENEIERKRSRFAESVISSDTPTEEVALAKRLIAATNAQFMDDVTFDTLIKALKDSGVERVRWVTAKDDRRCKVCKSMDGRIYPIDKVPAKPHIRCRCYVERVGADDRRKMSKV